MTTLALHRMNRLWLHRLADRIGGMRRTLQAWRERAHGRAQLARMSEVELRDIGLSRTDAWYETNKPFWRA